MSPSALPSQENIQNMFNGLAPRYDLFNRLTSLGMDKGWRRYVLKDLKPGMRVLDLGCGTGDLMLDAARRLGGNGEAVGLDFSQNMLDLARKRADDENLDCVRFECRGADDIPFEPEPYDMVVSAFVLRNIQEKLDIVLKGVRESLKNGGMVRFLDFTEPPNAFVRVAWRLYMNSVVTLYGLALFGKEFPVAYMTDSARRFLKAREFAEQLTSSGFKNVRVRKFMMGIIVLYEAEKP